MLGGMQTQTPSSVECWSKKERREEVGGGVGGRGGGRGRGGVGGGERGEGRQLGG